jgi:hypothetical protein
MATVERTRLWFPGGEEGFLRLEPHQFLFGAPTSLSGALHPPEIFRSSSVGVLINFKLLKGSQFCVSGGDWRGDGEIVGWVASADVRALRVPPIRH